MGLKAQASGGMSGPVPGQQGQAAADTSQRRAVSVGTYKKPNPVCRWHTPHRNQPGELEAIGQPPNQHTHSTAQPYFRCARKIQGLG